MTVSIERLEVDQLLEQVQAARGDLPPQLIERLLTLLKRDSPNRVQEIKALFRELARG